MHSLGVPQEMCLEFLKKQMSSFNIPKGKLALMSIDSETWKWFNITDKAKLIRDNILRMFHETNLWGAKESWEEPMAECDDEIRAIV